MGSAFPERNMTYDQYIDLHNLALQRAGDGKVDWNSRYREALVWHGLALVEASEPPVSSVYPRGAMSPPLPHPDHPNGWPKQGVYIVVAA